MPTPPAQVLSCLDCPSYLTPVDAAGKIGKSVSAPMCAQYGYVLGRPGASTKDNNHTLTSRAAACDKYGDPQPRKTPETLAIEVTLPDPDARIELDPMHIDRTLVKSCAQCANLVDDLVVADELGWTAGLCAAKGRLIMPNKRATEARGCEFRRVGQAPLTTKHLHLLPTFAGFGVKIDGTGQFVRGDDSYIEPLDYPTDKDVSDDDREYGIQAWRRIDDPEGTGNSVMIPIFDPKSFTEAERDIIPQTGDDEHPELYFDHNGAVYKLAVLMMELDETPAVWGMPGVGKTEVFRHLAWLMQLPFYRFSIKESTELYELEGGKEYDADKGTYFRDGRFTIAWGSRCMMVVDEPNLARPDVWAFLRPCMDNSKQLVIDADGGRRVPRHLFGFMGLAMNPAWSPLNVGTSPIGAADASRLMHIQFSLPEDQVERSILQNRAKLDGWKVDLVRMDLVMAVSERLRALADQGVLSFTWGVRENIKVLRALRWFDALTAYRMAAGDYLEPQQQEAALDQVRGSLPGSLPKIELLGDQS